VKMPGLIYVLSIAGALTLAAQTPPENSHWAGLHPPGDAMGEQDQPPPPPMGPRGPGMDRGRPQMERGRQMPPGRWWTDPGLVQRLGLTAEQQQKIDSIFQQSRLKLIDLNASLGKEQAILEPLLEAERPDESKVLAQIDRIAQARGELEKANARMLLGFRGVLTLDQWKKLQADASQGPPPDGGRGGRRP
jgi:periplasmic protein CpxP/Spy